MRRGFHLEGETFPPTFFYTAAVTTGSCAHFKKLSIPAAAHTSKKLSLPAAAHTFKKLSLPVAAHTFKKLSKPAATHATRR